MIMNNPNPHYPRSRIGDALAKATPRSALATACGLLVLVGAAQTVSAQIPYLRYSFDEASGPALDTSGKDAQANGTFVGTGTRTSITPGGYPGAAFDTGTGGGGYIDAGDADKLDGLQKFTLTAWLRLYGTPVNGQFIMAKRDGANTTGFSLLYGLPSGGATVMDATNFTIKVRVGTSTGSGVSADLNADHAWIFVAVTYDGTITTSNLKFYNGGPTTAVSSATTKTYNAGVPPANSESFQICAMASFASTVSAMVDDVRVYTNVLSQAQLETVRQSNLPATLWWDRSASTAGATNGVGGVASGVWSGSGVWSANNNWSISSLGTFSPQQWSDGSAARFAAGTDATGSYTVTVSNSPTASAVYIEEGSVLFNLSSVALTPGAVIDVADGSSATFGSTTIGGVAGVNKTGLGTVALNGANAYGGATAVSNGTLLVNGSIASATTVYSGGTLGGTGTISGAVVITTNANISPGASAGLLTLQAGLDLSGGGTYVWELATNSTATPGTDFDQISLTGGGLVLGGSSSLSINFTGTATTPTSSDPFWQATRSWVVVALSGSGVNSGNATFATVSNATYSAGTFSTATNASGSIVLTFSPSASGPVVQAPVVTSTNVTLSWSSSSGLTYQVQYNTNLLTTNWIVLTNVTAGGNTTSATDTPGTDPARFYRVVLLP